MEGSPQRQQSQERCSQRHQQQSGSEREIETKFKAGDGQARDGRADSKMGLSGRGHDREAHLRRSGRPERSGHAHAAASTSTSGLRARGIETKVRSRRPRVEETVQELAERRYIERALA